jgi:hypothetical protein
MVTPWGRCGPGDGMADVPAGGEFTEYETGELYIR